jgi:hypothetical protein
MNPHPRIRKTAKWGGAVVCVVLVGVWVSSTMLFAFVATPRGFYAEIVAGRLQTMTSSDNHDVVPHTVWNAMRVPVTVRWWFSTGYLGPLRVLAIPLWPPAALALAPTLLAWRLDALARRRARLNYCPSCNYDRRGLPTASLCPECGSVPTP